MHHITTEQVLDFLYQASPFLLYKSIHINNGVGVKYSPKRLSQFSLKYIDRLTPSCRGTLGNTFKNIPITQNVQIQHCSLIFFQMSEAYY